MLTILNVAYPLAPVSSGAVGGAEQVLSMLDSALVAHGHQSIVIAASGSATAGKLIELPAVPDKIDNTARARAWQACRDAIRLALNENAIDVVHLHGSDFYEYLPSGGCSVLATIHLPISWYPPNI